MDKNLIKQRNTIYFFLIFSFNLFFCGCSFFQGFIGSPGKILDKNENFVEISLNYKPDFVFQEIKKYFAKNSVVVYKEQKNMKIYARNFGKVYKNVNMSTEVLLKLEENGEFTNIKISSFNRDLAENLKQKMKEIISQD